MTGAIVTAVVDGTFDRWCAVGNDRVCTRSRPVPGISSVAHLRENRAAAELELSDEVMATLGKVAASIET
jgi:aryl-alcohol dehydrogenase-like predicted oxidoreductase